MEIDARGLACPGPVLETKRALERGEGELQVLVDNPTATENVSRFARSSGCSVEVTEEAGCYHVRVTPSAAARPGVVPAVSGQCPTGGVVLFVSSDEVGRGERDIGTTLMKMFLHTCAESAAPLSTAVFLNSGVRLVTEDDEAAGHVRELERQGTEVLVCGTCLDYYGLKERLQAGRVSNMYEIQAALVGATSLLSL